MNKFIFDLIIQGGWYEIPEFNSQEEFEEYIGEKVPVKFDELEQDINNFVEEWKSNHNFSVLENNLEYYDLEKGYVERVVIYTLDNKFYKIYYYAGPDLGYELRSGPYEVIPVKETVEITKYVIKQTII